MSCDRDDRVLHCKCRYKLAYLQIFRCNFIKQMKYNESVRLLSASRINKYKSACGGDKAKTIQLYQYNIKLCQRFYGIMSMFEIMLRNLINEHYLTQFQDANASGLHFLLNVTTASATKLYYGYFPTKHMD